MVLTGLAYRQQGSKPPRKATKQGLSRKTQPIRRAWSVCQELDISRKGNCDSAVVIWRSFSMTGFEVNLENKRRNLVSAFVCEAASLSQQR